MLERGILKMTSNERVRLVRNALDLTLEKFAKKLNVTSMAISNIEKGNRALTERMAKAICKEYTVDYTWLTTGEGDMFIDSDDAFMAKIDAILTGEDDNFKNLFRIMVDFSDEEIQFINSMIDKIIALKEEQNKK